MVLLYLHNVCCVFIFVQLRDSVKELKGEGVLRLLLQPWEAREVAVVFTPSEHKPTTTILLIRYSPVAGWSVAISFWFFTLKKDFSQSSQSFFYYKLLFDVYDLLKSPLSCVLVVIHPSPCASGTT